MSTSSDHDDGYGQLRATVFVLFALGTMALAISRLNRSSMSILEWAAPPTAIAACAAIMLFAVSVPVHKSPLFGAWLAVVLGGGMLAIASNAGGTAYQESPLLVRHYFVGLIGVLQTSLWSPLGLIAAWLVAKFRGRHDFLSGIVCGVATAIPLSRDAHLSTPPLPIYMTLLGACGGWGAAAQRARSIAHRRRSVLPTEVDEFACQTVAKHPKPRKPSVDGGRFRIRKVLQMPSRLRHWWPF